MYSKAKFQIIGRVGRVQVRDYATDGETRELVNLNIAVDDFRRKDEQGQTATDWHRVTVFGETLVKIAKGLQGQYVLIEGEIRIKERGEGESRTFHTNLIGTEIGFLQPKAQERTQEPAEEARTETAPKAKRTRKTKAKAAA